MQKRHQRKLKIMDRVKPWLSKLNYEKYQTLILLFVIGLYSMVTLAQNTNGNGEEVAGEKPADSGPLAGQPYVE